MTTLDNVLDFINYTATPYQIAAIQAMLSTGGNPARQAARQATGNKQEIATSVLSEINAGQKVTFTYNGVEYNAVVKNINRKTATVVILAMSAPSTKKGIIVGKTVRVGALLLKQALNS